MSKVIILVIFVFSQFNLYSQMSLEDLERQVQRDFTYLNQPAVKWVKGSSKEVLDVAIIGGGMAGMSAALSLKREGIQNICLFDENSTGEEGPWITCARMHHLRSPKALMGPACGIPSLTYRSWFEASKGIEAWESLKYIPTASWQEYLCWFRKVLNLPIKNNMTLEEIVPREGYLELVFDNGIVKAKKVVLATGREGFGGREIPDFMHGISKSLYAHTGECIDCLTFSGKRVVVIGAGASAFDAAGAAIESGAKDVKMLVRRASIPTVNKFSKLTFPGILHGFHLLPDDRRCQLLGEAFEAGIPPSRESVERISGAKNLTVHYEVGILAVKELGSRVALSTTKGDIEADFIILGTGYGVDAAKLPELVKLNNHILFWRNRLPEDFIARQPKMGNFPYLGAHFQFMEKDAGAAPYLKDIYCFNYGAFLSHGLVSGDITGISVGANRLALGIAADFFVEGIEEYERSIKDYSSPLFDPSDYEVLNPAISF